MAVRPRFDPKRPLVAARDFTFMGAAYAAGAPFNPEGASDRLRARQYEARVVNYAEGDAAEEAPAQLVTMTGPSGGRYTITAPWIAEPEVVRGKVNAEKRLAELREAGPPLGFIEGGSAVTVEGGEGGWYEVNAPWLDEAEKVQGREAAESRQAELHAAGEPASYKGYTLTPGDNGWYAITKDGVETDPPVALNVHGEEDAREAVATLRAGELIEGVALPDDWATETLDEGSEGGEGGTDGEGGASEQDPPAGETEGGEPQTEEAMTDDNKDKQTADTAPNEPGTNEPNGAEVINDEQAAEGEGGDEGGDGTTGTVGP